MHLYLENILVKKYPGIFQQYGGDMRETCMHWGIACGSGWFKLIDKLCNDLSKYPEVVASQVKEKFGGLRFYIEGVDKDHSDAIYNHIDAAEGESLKTCEDCGEPGKTRGGGWVRTLCNQCEQNKRIIEKIREGMCCYTIKDNKIEIFNDEGTIFKDTLEYYIKLMSKIDGLLEFKDSY